MKIAVLNNCVPFVAGGAEHLGTALTQKLNEYGHQAALVRVPFAWEPASKVVESILACRLLRMPNVDRVIALKFPVYCVPHDNKVLWLLHQFRQAYDFWGTEFQGIPSTPEGEKMRNVIVQADNAHIPEARRIYTNSHVTSERLMKFNGIESTVLYPPLLRSDHFRCEDYGDYIFYPSRINATKRQALMVESMRFVRTGARLIVAGKPEAPGDLDVINNIIKRHGLQSRVEIIPRFVTEAEKADLFSGALGCAYVPVDEDSYGYVTLEAFSSVKPVITCTDSGGTDIVVKDGVTGYVVPPEPQAIAQAIDRLYEDKQLARSMGAAGLDLIRNLGISWDHVIRTLTE